MFGLLGAPDAAAQFACSDTLSLRSPDTLDVDFELDPVTGNRLTWPAVTTQDGACYRLEASAEIQTKFNPDVTGGYVDIFDRALVFTAEGNGIVGDQTQDKISLFLESNSPNPAIPPLNGEINLSNRGGAFLVDLGDGSSVQSNSGIPAHLSTTDLTSMVTWGSGASSRVYAAVTGLPLLRSDDGGGTWIETSADLSDPIGFPITQLAVSPANADIVYAATSKAGLWRSLDAGATFERADQALTDTDANIASVTLLDIGGSERLFVALSGVGLFLSDDESANFTAVSLAVPADFDTENSPSCLGEFIGAEKYDLTRIVQSPADPQVLYAGLGAWGVYKSLDGGANWTRANETLVLCNSQTRSERPVTVEQMHVFQNQASGNDAILVSSEFEGVFGSTDGGNLWFRASGLPDDQNGTPVRITGFVEDLTDDRTVVAATREFGLYISSDFGATWTEVRDDAGTAHGQPGFAHPEPAEPEPAHRGYGGGGGVLAGHRGAARAHHRPHFDPGRV